MELHLTSQLSLVSFSTLWDLKDRRRLAATNIEFLGNATTTTTSAKFCGEHIDRICFVYLGVKAPTPSKLGDCHYWANCLRATRKGGAYGAGP
jgi:hypothetical protein